MKRILLVISGLGAGGAERVMTELANYWAREGLEVIIVTLSPKKTVAFYSIDSRIKLDQLGQLTRNKKNLISRLSEILKRITALRLAIRRHHPDVIVSFIDVMNITTLIASLGLRAPVVVSERIDPNFHKIPLPYKWMRVGMYRFSKSIVVQTDSSADYFKGRLKSKIKIIPNFVIQPKKIKTSLASSIKKIVSVGRLSPQKNHEALIKAFHKLGLSELGCTLYIYGEGSKRKELAALISELSLEDFVFLPGAVSEIYDVLLDADLFVFPSIYEGFPNALSEAMSIGLPCVASACSGNVDVIEEGVNGLLFPVGDLDGLVTQMRRAISDPDLCRMLSKNAVKVSSVYATDKIFSQWNSLLNVK